jgi:N-methylhydantoinase B
MFTGNVRLPDQIAGDLSAMSNVFTVGRRGLDTLIARYGREKLADCIREMMDRSEAQMRSYIAEIPDGKYRFEDFFDNDGIVDEPVKIVLTLMKSGTDLNFDFSGTDKATRGPINLALTTTLSSCYVALKHIFPEVPVNGGAFRPTKFNVPEGSLLCVTYPTPVGGYLEVVGRLLDVVFGALAQAIPQRTPAASFGTTGVTTVGGRHPRTGRYFVAVFPYPGGYGAYQGGDGLVNGVTPQSMANFMSIEMSEHRYPLRFRHFAIRENSGGAGKFRGGCGTTYSFEPWGDCVVSVLGDRVDHVPFGIAGGGPAAPNEVRYRTGNEEHVPPLRSKYEKQALHAGDLVMNSSPGGGGFGNPLERALDAVELDLNLGYISRETAERDYGAVIAQATPAGEQIRYRLDMAASQAKRSKAQSQGVHS